MNRYKRAAARRIFFKEFRIHMNLLLGDRKLMKHFKRQFRHHTGYTTGHIDKIIRKWTILGPTRSEIYARELDRQFYKELTIMHRRGKQYK